MPPTPPSEVAAASDLALLPRSKSLLPLGNEVSKPERKFSPRKGKLERLGVETGESPDSRKEGKGKLFDSYINYACTTSKAQDDTIVAECQTLLYEASRMK